jgi:hypothetical protein
MRAGLLCALLVAVGCGGTNRCKSGTALITVTLAVTSQAGDTLALAVSVDHGAPISSTVPLTAGHTSGTVEVVFPSGYPGGRRLDIGVQQLRGSQLMGAGDVGGTLGAGCETFALMLSVGSPDLAPASDMATADGLAPDLAMPDLAMADQAMLDLATPDLTGPLDLSVAPDLLSIKHIFVTSQLFDGNLGGLAGADAKCQAAANAGVLGGTYMAWLSTPTLAASSRLSQSTGPYVLPDGSLVANGWAGLTSGTLLHAIDVTEFGMPATTAPANQASCTGVPGDQLVWTNTDTNGGIANNNALQSCGGNWSSNAAGQVGLIGRLSATDGSWAVVCGGGPCQNVAPLYCLEQ